ncbi:MAG: hypothetical protein PF508_17820 [Spirochaeta sp.]|jgi:hypothetical protein|nr:hypothetical protein [Spirochaeta sp.]
MKKRRITLLIAGIVAAGALSGCVSLEEYDQWQLDAYEAEGTELERFEELASQYEHSVLFDSVADETVMRGVTGTGTVQDGVYRFAHDAESEYAHFDIRLEYLQDRTGAGLQRVAFLAKAQNHGNGFVEVYPGGNVKGDGGNPVSIADQGGLANGAWTLVEFIADGGTTIVKGHGYERVLNQRLERLSIFCFHGSSIEIDYILVE